MGEWVTADSGYREAKSAAPFFFFFFVFFCVLITLPTTSTLTTTVAYGPQKKPEKGREAAAPSNIKEIQEIQGGQEAPLDGDAINPKDA